jgi:hypothetical protein
MKRKLTFHQKLWIGMALLVIVPALLYGVWLLSLMTLDSEQEISGPVTISTEWTEFTPKEPLQPDKETQEVVLNSAEPLVRNTALHDIRLADGTAVKPELQLIDQSGNVFVADDVDRYPTPSLYNEGISCSVTRLPQDRLYTKVRVRSDKTLKLSRIVWHCHTGK